MAHRCFIPLLIKFSGNLKELAIGTVGVLVWRVGGPMLACEVAI